MNLRRVAFRSLQIGRHFSSLPTRTGPRGGPDLTARSAKGSSDLIQLDEGVMNIRAFGDRVFQLNEVMVRESVLVFQKSFLVWNAKVESDITIENLAMIPLMFPTVEILIIGTGLLSR